MSKVRENFRVVADIDERHSYGMSRKTREPHYESYAKTLKEQVKRHCDANNVWIEWDTVCEHCGRSWEEDSNTKEPVCCDKAQTEFAEQQTAKAPVS